MANTVRQIGFKPSQSFGSGDTDDKQRWVLATSANNIGIGDVVIHTGAGGTAGTFVNGINCEGMPIVDRASSGTAGQNYFGVVTGVMPTPANAFGGTKHRVASVNTILMVNVDLITGIFEVQEDAVTTPLVAATSIGKNIAINLGSVSTTTGYGSMTLQSTSVATTNTLPCRIVGLLPRVDVAFNTGGAGVDPATFLVQFNTSLWAANIASV